MDNYSLTETLGHTLNLLDSVRAARYLYLALVNRLRNHRLTHRTIPCGPCVVPAFRVRIQEVLQPVGVTRFARH